MTTLQFADTHNLVAFLSKPVKSEGFEQIVDFLNAKPIRYALTINPTIYTSCIEQFWATAKVKTVNGEVQLQALVDGKKIIVTKASVRRYLQLNDEEDFVADERCLEATLNEPSSLGTSSGSGPRRQETMGDTMAQTRFENVSKTSNDSLLTGVNTPRSDEDSLKLKELMELFEKCVKRLEKKNRSKTHGLKRFYKVGLSRRVESSDEEGLDKEDASKQGRIADIDANVGINLVSTHFDTDTYMFRVHDLVGVEGKHLQQSASSQPTSQINVQDKGKGKMVEPKPVKKLSKKDQLMLNEELAFKLQATEEEEEEKEERLAKEKFNTLKSQH
ncbi:hypothetical protein Tco_1180457 [Tanacetum coccineum]